MDVAKRTAAVAAPQARYWGAIGGRIVGTEHAAETAVDDYTYECGTAARVARAVCHVCVYMCVGIALDERFGRSSTQRAHTA